MPYAGFRLAEDGAIAPQLSLSSTAETLTQRGLGVALNPRPDQTADWVFTCGDLLSLQMFGRITPGAESPTVEGTADREVPPLRLNIRSETERESRVVVPPIRRVDAVAPDA